MSAFIVDQETMRRVIAGVERLVKDSPGYWIPKLNGKTYEQCFSPESPYSEATPLNYMALGNRLFELNRAAVYARYEGRHESGDPAPIYAHKRSLCTAIQSFKALKCLRYQCSEGDCDESPDYALLESFISGLAEKIVTRLPEYDRADWG